MEFFRVEEPGTGQTVPLTWLKLFWVRKHSDAMSFRSAYLRRTSDEEQDPGVIPDAGGMFGGHAVFTEALTKDIQPELARTLASCPLAAGSLGHDGGVPGPGGQGRDPGELVERHARVIPRRARDLNLGALRKHLLRGAEAPYAHGPGATLAADAIRAQQAAPGGLPAARLQRLEGTLLGRAEHGALPAEHGAGLGLVDVQRPQGERKEGVTEESPGLGHMDASVERYENFEFVWSAEHGQNRHGYITEKIVNALLAGAVPVYAGSSQVGQVFNTDSFIQVDMSYDAARHEAAKRVIAASHDKERYSKLQHRDKPVVSDAAMKRFFTWHPDVWATYGDGLRQEVLHEALRFCKGGH
eukprot:CAMPEP_0168361786 /NCGR_PEP_ID=MMETSP0228-20121227/2842_1 /TAXON_ID=133427 /ORGANISM="Protoceratium reticulatum, Strain CCCM 535 (=CCMP 1889)" /LENGTH=355 /DNA_ID=CAMNT_0008374467 /DNA_START=197 /DNA_END=1266 /DNA_ORIENTATION=+